MNTTKKILLTAFICLTVLLLATAMSAVLKRYEERPFRIHGDATVLIDWANPQTDSDGRVFVPWTLEASEVATDGWFKSTGAGVLYTDTLVAEGTGESCECSDGTITWECTAQLGLHHVTLNMTSGTGQFEGARGQFEYQYTPFVSELNEDGNLVKLIYSYWGEGKMGLMQ